MIVKLVLLSCLTSIKKFGQLQKRCTLGYSVGFKRDSLQVEIANTAFVMGFDYGKDWFLLYLLVILGAFIYKLIRGL